MQSGEQGVPLRRSLSLPLLVLYGLGTTIGAGIYALIGEVVHEAGGLAPLSFLCASLLAGFTAFSFAELGARFPRSAGEAVYVSEGFHLPPLALLVGLLVVLSGVSSTATIVNSFTGYVQLFLPLPRWLCISGIVLLLGALAGWGVRESVLAAAVITVLEVFGLLMVLWAGAGHYLANGVPAEALQFHGGWIGVGGVMQGALLAFFAFLGFEDMVNMAEETRNVRRTLPRAIIITLLLSTLLYVLVSLVAVAVGGARASGEGAALVRVYEMAGGRYSTVLGAIGILALLNGALVQIIMGARVLYGLSNQRLLPSALAAVHPFTRTPLLATATVIAVVLLLALSFRLVILAEATSLLILMVFALVNAALFRVKRRAPRLTEEGITVPLWVPVVGCCVCLAFLLYGLSDVWL